MKIPLPKNFEPQQPLKISDYQDMMVTLFCPQIHPCQFNLEKLKETKTIPFDWQLSKPILKKPNLLQLIFDKGITINIEIHKISFFSKINQNIQYLSEVVKNFLIKFINYNWQKLQLSLRRFISLPGNSENGAKFIQETLLKNSNQWNVLGHKLIKAQINLCYNLIKSNLIIQINDLKINNKNKQKFKNGLLFRGIFSYNLAQKGNIEKINYLISIVTNYQNNIKVFNQIINEQILT
ncbi:hypothetical protein [Geminocystis sp. NIES-3709]|uniref:hypothetical protein n=1 Tax=Geminocystis sp. NIES-3709 TaxID=1617448 RepID=UPI0005FC8EB6|nr:hypothetical protein [Geminocystis sp. NIES-3709]BAQ63312.1 hypothetical protein GM3709_77 [Geminocystis sp. NIES-3709]